MLSVLKISMLRCVVNIDFAVFNILLVAYQQKCTFFRWNDMEENGIKWNKIVLLRLIQRQLAFYGTFRRNT